MRKLELKDICSYLPYGLYLQVEAEDGLFVGQFNGYDNNGNISVCCGMQCTYGRCEDDNIKPILRPLSDLTKPITHKGETFVPIVELAKINEPEYTSIEINDKGRVFINTPYVENMTMVYDSINAIFLNLTIRKDGAYRLETNRAARNQQPLFDKLSEWLFDYRDLICQGLALPVTEEFNPYKQ